MSAPADRPGLDRITEIVLGGPALFTRAEVVDAVGVPIERVRPYWRAMGFADVGGARAFTERDVESLRLLLRWVDDDVLDEGTTIEVVRSLGQTASRLADWQAHTIARLLSESEPPIDLDEVAEGLADVLPGLESLMVHAWRRHLAAVLSRGLASVAEDPEAPAPPEPATATVGFADIAGFTRLARVLDEEDLAAMVQAFETGAADIVASHGGRLVKTLGDEVMFVAPRADDAVAIAVAMHGMVAPGMTELSLRIGLASGRLISRMGDFYGGTVNLASRLTAIARPGGTLIDPLTEEALVDREHYVLRHMRPRPLRGLGLVRATSVAPRVRHIRGGTG
ncbi:MAG: adenylate/guanylate cyclase domain-containing protein [Candidatus Nanopelagicales bacterium]